MPRESLLPLLQASQRSLIDSLPFPVFVRSPEGHYLACNQLFLDLLGLSEDQVVGATAADLVPAALADDYLVQNAEVWSGRRPVCRDGRVRRADGAIRDVRFHRSVLYAENGEAMGVIGVIEDVTEERAAQAALAASEERFARLAELTGEGVVLHAYGTIVDVNDAMLRMTGWSRDDLVGRHYSMLLPADAHRVAEAHVASRSDQVYRVAIMRADGGSFPAELRGRGIAVDQRDIRVTTVTDISARLQAERAMRDHELLYRQMFENNRAVKLLIDPANGQIIDANPAAAAFYGWPLDQLRRMNIAEINALPPDRIKAEMDLAQGEQRLFFRFKHRLRGGDIRQVEVYSGPCLFHGRSLLHSIIVDVTERECAFAELRDKTEALAQSNADLQQFAYVASHDLQEPLRSVASYLQLLEKRYRGHIDDEADTFIRFAVDGAKRMRALIQDLLCYSRVESQGHDMESLECVQVVDSSLANLHHLLQVADAKVRVDEPLPRVRGDRAQLTSVFQNLIGNAVKYRHRSRAPEIRVSAEAGEVGEWVISVADNGIGIAEEFHERVFGIFQRLHSQTAYPGTGIGLALARRIVSRHGGRIWVESQEGAGCVFRFTLRGG